MCVSSSVYSLNFPISGKLVQCKSMYKGESRICGRNNFQLMNQNGVMVVQLHPCPISPNCGRVHFRLLLFESWFELCRVQHDWQHNYMMGKPVIWLPLWFRFVSFEHVDFTWAHTRSLPLDASVWLSVFVSACLPLCISGSRWCCVAGLCTLCFFVTMCLICSMTIYGDRNVDIWLFVQKPKTVEFDIYWKTTTSRYA